MAANPYQYNPYLNGANNVAGMGNMAFQPISPQPQPIFPAPQGNVYTINNTLEVANVPASSGLTVALCLNEGLMYIKSIQNGQPMFWAYKMVPYQEDKKEEGEDRIKALEEKVDNLLKELEGE